MLASPVWARCAWQWRRLDGGWALVALVVAFAVCAVSRAALLASTLAVAVLAIARVALSALRRAFAVWARRVGHTRSVSLGGVGVWRVGVSLGEFVSLWLDGGCVVLNAPPSERLHIVAVSGCRGASASPAERLRLPRSVCEAPRFWWVSLPQPLLIRGVKLASLPSDQLRKQLYQAVE